MKEKPSKRKQRFSETVSVRLTEEEKRFYDKVSSSKGLSTNAYIRLVLRENVFNKSEELLPKDD